MLRIAAVSSEFSIFLECYTSRSNADISVNIVYKWTSYIFKFKFIYTEYKDICLVAIALIVFKYCKIKEEYFFGTPSTVIITFRHVPSCTDEAWNAETCACLQIVLWLQIVHIALWLLCHILSALQDEPSPLLRYAYAHKLACLSALTWFTCPTCVGHVKWLYIVALSSCSSALHWWGPVGRNGNRL